MEISVLSHLLWYQSTDYTTAFLHFYPAASQESFWTVSYKGFCHGLLLWCQLAWRKEYLAIQKSFILVVWEGASKMRLACESGWTKWKDWPQCGQAPSICWRFRKEGVMFNSHTGYHRWPLDSRTHTSGSLANIYTFGLKLRMTSSAFLILRPLNSVWVPQSVSQGL